MSMEAMLDITKDIQSLAAADDAWEGIRQGLEDYQDGRLKPAREFFDEFETRHGIPD